MSRPLRHRALLPALALALASAVGLSACFIEAQPGTNFRFECDATTDCEDGETCVSGLCQVECTIATFQQDCPSTGDYTGCLNGVCANTCSTADDTCPSPTECLSAPSSIGGPLSGLFGGGSVEVCGETCSELDPTSCPTGEICDQGVCVPPCNDLLAPCGEGSSCVNQICVPDDPTDSTGTGTDGGGA